MSSYNEIILTGVPRSGTTLSCYLLNRLPNVVALHEPMDVGSFAELGDHASVSEVIREFFVRMRTSSLTRRLAVSKQVAGKVPDNSIATNHAEMGLRPNVDSLGEIRIDKELDGDFVLVIKHPTAFTAILDTLSEQFRCYAVIRNPLAVLASWNTVALPVEQGHIPMAENLDQQLKTQLASQADKIGRQLYLLRWFFDRYLRILPQGSILRYEEIVSSGGRALSTIVPWADKLNETLNNKNYRPVCAPDLMARAGERLLATDGPYWEFYSREDVRRLLTYRSQTV